MGQLVRMLQLLRSQGKWEDNLGLMGLGIQFQMEGDDMDSEEEVYQSHDGEESTDNPNDQQDDNQTPFDSLNFFNKLEKYKLSGVRDINFEFWLYLRNFTALVFINYLYISPEKILYYRQMKLL